MSWTSLDEYDATSSSEVEDDLGEINGSEKNSGIEDELSGYNVSRGQSRCDPFVQVNYDGFCTLGKFEISQNRQNLILTRRNRILTTR